jgi:glucose 1-dehydrogenase
MRLQDKVALVTGANSGIGKGIALRFAAEGAHVAVNYLPGGTRQADAEAIVAQFGTAGIAVGGDVSKREDVERMVAEIVAKFGRLDIAVNNAGIEIKKPFLDVTDDEWNRVIAVNLYGSFLVSQAAARQMVKQGQGGKLVNISSVHEDIPFPQYTAYCASKGGMRMMMRNLAMELAPYKINVNNIAPGAIETEMARFAHDQATRAAYNYLIPMTRYGTPEEIADAAIFLCSDESRYVQGHTLNVDGGFRAAGLMFRGDKAVPSS